jgi:hypothetical protein
MPAKKHKPEEIIGKLREVEIVLGQEGYRPRLHHFNKSFSFSLLCLGSTGAGELALFARVCSPKPMIEIGDDHAAAFPGQFVLSRRAEQGLRRGG